MMEVDQAARELAARGEVTIARVAAIAEQARLLFEAGDLQPSTAPEHEPNAWEGPEGFPIDAPFQIYLASVEDFATGEGLTVSFFAGRAPSENAFRRSIAREVGVFVADRAVIGQGSEATVPFAKMFRSSALLAKLEQIESGEDRPGAFAFFARWHVNYS